jgi:predicted nucleotidyltransferase
MTSEFAEGREANVEAVLLFGSKSRGDDDSYSDTDLAVFAHVGSTNELAIVKRCMARIVGKDIASLSIYSTITAERMAVEGSLFLWHLKLEGKILQKRSNWIDELLESLPTYSSSKAGRDLRTFELVLEDIGQSLRSMTVTIQFEIATLYSVLRNLGMMVAALSGKPCFGRLEPITWTKRLMGSSFRITEEEIQTLLEARMTYSRGVAFKDRGLDPEWGEETRLKVLDVATFARDLIDERTY